MKLKILSWDVKGANDGEIKKFKPVIRTQKTYQICLLETKVQMVRSPGVRRFLDWGAMEAQGVLGGILVFWDNRGLELLDMEGGGWRVLHLLPI